MRRSRKLMALGALALGLAGAAYFSGFGSARSESAPPPETSRRIWVEFSGSILTGAPVWRESGWCELPILRGTTGRVVLPNRSTAADLSGIVDGMFTIYHSEGKRKALKSAEYPYVSGWIRGVATFWDDHGHVVRQELWGEPTTAIRSDGAPWNPAEADPIEEKTSPPWWNDVEDQVPPDGVYTKLRWSTLVGAGRQASMFRQWRYESGQIVDRRDGCPWLEPDPEFSERMAGQIIFFPGAGETRYQLGGRPVADGQVLRIRDGPRVRVEFADDGTSSRVWYVLVDDHPGATPGRRVELSGAHLEFCEE